MVSGDAEHPELHALLALLLARSRCPWKYRLISVHLSPASASLGQPMKIEIVVDPIRAVPLASRVAPAPKAAAAAAPQPRLVTSSLIV